MLKYLYGYDFLHTGQINTTEEPLWRCWQLDTSKLPVYKDGEKVAVAMMGWANAWKKRLILDVLFTKWDDSYSEMSIQWDPEKTAIEELFLDTPTGATYTFGATIERHVALYMPDCSCGAMYTTSPPPSQ